MEAQTTGCERKIGGGASRYEQRPAPPPPLVVCSANVPRTASCVLHRTGVQALAAVMRRRTTLSRRGAPPCAHSRVTRELARVVAARFVGGGAAVERIVAVANVAPAPARLRTRASVKQPMAGKGAIGSPICGARPRSPRADASWLRALLA